jgi:hypothetical protein
MIHALRADGPGLEPRRSSARYGARSEAPALWRTLLVAVVCLHAGAIGAGAQPPPPARPASATPAPAQPPAAEAPIREALQQYSTAVESLDADQVKKIFPSVDVEQLRRAFREMREIKVSIDNVKVLSTEGAVARVSCRVTQTFTPKAGAKRNDAVMRVLRLRRQEAVWVIDGFER